VLRGVLDVGFSSYAVPTYGLVSEYFRFQELRLGLVLKDVRQRRRCSAMCNAISFSVQGLGAKHPEGAWSIGSGNKLSRLYTQSQFTRCLTSRMEGPYILEL